MSALLLSLALAMTPSPQAQADPTVSSVKTTFDVARGYITKAAEQMPEDKYSFKPTPDVRSFGALLGHIADANFMICSAASGESATMKGVEKSKTTKAELQEALNQSFAFCEKAFAGMTGARADETVKFFLPGTFSRLGVLAFNNAHNFEHYGNIATYMRMNKMVPPSTAGMK